MSYKVWENIDVKQATRVVGDVSRKFLNSSGLHHITASASNWAPRPKNFWLKIRWGTEGREGEGGEMFFPSLYL